ncbi:MAG: Fpg/Nei family DNA glycosylase [Ruthenibacterium sp.]
MLQFSNGMELRFSDTRRFGRFWLIPFGEEDTDSGIGKLGPEPFSAGCNAGYLQARLGKRKKAIKACLLDQSVVAGIGNIYSDEILFRANINPARPAGSLTAAEWQRLAAEIPQCLAYFIEKNRTTPEEYWQTKGQGYGNTPFLQVYGHGGEPARTANRACPRCWRQKQRILPALPGRGGGMRRDGEENPMKYCKKRAGGIHYIKAHT